MSEITIQFAISWWCLGLGFLIGATVAMFGILYMTYSIEKKCTCDAWKVKDDGK